MLDVRRLRVLKEVAIRGSFSAAAEALSYTQPAVSQQVAALEREAGTVLVRRSARGVRLTEAGEVLVSHAEAILSRLAEAEADLQALTGVQAGRLRLMAFDSAGATIMPPAIARLRERHPGIEVTLEPGEGDAATAAVRAGDVDVALDVSWPGRRAADDGVQRTFLLDDPMYVVLPAGHPLAGRARVRLADLAGEQWITGTPNAACSDSQILVGACVAAGFDPRIAFHSEDYNAIQGFVAAGVGLSLIPDLALVSVRDDVVVRSLGARPPYRVIEAMTAEGFRTPVKQAALDVLVEVGAEFAGRNSALALAS
ncbi:MAG TPA: LysR family transcriptional regulator [Solirubrobacteraceae bacterium]|nr:LysR family transcriptional regulator [Solirubrobacteraceae bacterium]